MEKPLYLGKHAAAKTIGVWRNRVEEVLGAPNAVIITAGTIEWSGYSIGRVLAYAYGKDRKPWFGTPRTFYNRAAIELRCSTIRGYAKGVLDEPDAIYQAVAGATDFPLWTGKNAAAAIQLIEEARQSGCTEYDRQRPRLRRVSGKQTATAERVRTAQLNRIQRQREKLQPPKPRGIIVQALHRDASNIAAQRWTWRK